MRFITLLFLLSLTTLQAGRHFLCCDHNGGKVAVVAADGTVEWEYACRAPQDCWKLPNGNILFCHVSGAIEMTQEKKIVWEYKAPEKTEVHACQPLADGRVLVVECGSSRLLEVDREGKIAKEIKLVTAPAIDTHNQYRGARKLPNGHYLVCFKGEHKVVELDAEGKVVHELPVPGDVHEALRLPDGHLLVTCGDGHKVVEFDAEEKVVWELNENDLTNNPLRLMAGCQRLANGNTLFCNYLGHGHIGKQPMVMEVTRDKKVVWEFADHAHFKTINQIFDLDEKTPAVR
jgi:outer membrane protein assembly factor BamB